MNDDFADQDVLDLDEEEMQLLWRKLATHAKRKRMRERDAAAAWMYHYGNGTGVPPSPGAFGGPLGGPMGSMGANGGMGGHLNMAHSFSSPVERPEIVARGASGGSVARASMMKDAPALDTAASSGGDSSAGVKEQVVEEKKDLTIKDLKED